MNKGIAGMLIGGLLVMGCKSAKPGAQVEAVCKKIATVCLNDKADFL